MKIIAIGAHLDDIELACGGTLARAVENGHSVKMIVLSESDYTNYDGQVLRTKGEALREGNKAAEILGVQDLVILNNPTKDIPYHSSTVEQIERELDAFNPDLIFSHWTFDTHQAHQGSALSTISAGRRYPSILMYEPMFPAGRSYVGFRAQLYQDISNSLEKKLASLRAHEGQFKKYGQAWLDAVEARARTRGFEAGCKYAETFELLRMELKL